MTAAASSLPLPEPSPVLRVATYNIHKGFSQFNRRLTVHDLRDRLRHLNPDLVMTACMKNDKDPCKHSFFCLNTVNQFIIQFCFPGSRCSCFHYFCFICLSIFQESKL